ncbi:hypothetical protein FSP39_006127 [Pinctada imbricata]|uniref:Uncharacterized protein n=1 Tax=Pinctada imbricata TaxID=66713 RepID=A0AA88XGB8_PINIB|nr:hypothetical protein FSP39_006127 [Pinctada imbricata]
MAVTKQAAPYMVTYLSSSIPQLQDQSAWALGNLAADSQECKEIIRAQGIVNPLIQLLQSPHPKVVHSAAFALANLAKGSIEIAQEMIQNNVISNLLPHFKYSTENEAILSEVSWVFTYLAASGNFTEPLISSGVLTQIVALLVQMSNVKPHIATVVTPMLRCLGNICSGPDDNTMKACENADLLPSLAVYLSSDLRHARKETLWVLSNMTGDLSVCKAVTYGPHLSLVLQQVPAAFDVKIEALYLLCNIACHGEDLCNHMVENGVLETVVPCLKLSDVEILNLSLALCEMCLRMSTGAKQHFDKQCEGIARLEALEYHNNDTLRKQAIHVLETYFEKEEETGKE